VSIKRLEDMALEGLMKADDKIYADLVTSKNDKIK